MYVDSFDSSVLRRGGSPYGHPCVSRKPTNHGIDERQGWRTDRALDSSGIPISTFAASPKSSSPSSSPARLSLSSHTTSSKLVTRGCSLPSAELRASLRRSGSGMSDVSWALKSVSVWRETSCGELRTESSQSESEGRREEEGPVRSVCRRET